MLHPRLSRAAFGSLLLLGLAGCGGSDLSRTFGLTRDTPDEFTVTTRAPLSMPPDYSLRPPQPGAPRPQEMSARRAAEADLAPQSALNTAPAGVSAGEQAFLNAAGPPAPANIRQEVSQDFARDTSGNSITDKLMFWTPSKPGPGVAVDPAKEAERLRTNAALGQNADTGTTPIIQEHKSFWERLF
jgi:hypothetical protein